MTEAHDVAGGASRRSAVAVRTLERLPDLHEFIATLDEIWRPSPDRPMLTIEQARALSHAGNYLAGAYDGSRMVGACVGFFAAPPGAALHSHIAGVLPEAHGRAVGFAIKLHQRAWALDQGLSEITWTFDPLVRRNAYFNMVKLGARPRTYYADFYGEIVDAINAGQGSDRLLMAWDLAGPRAVAACAGERQETDTSRLRRAGAVVALAETESGKPMAPPAADVESARVHLVQIPRDIEGLRKESPELGMRWRLAVRDTLGTLVRDGAQVTGFTRDGHYVVEREPR